MKTKKFQSTKKKKGELRSRMKPAKRGLLVKGSWKAVQLDPSLFSEEDMGGLVCFEELTDYRLVDSSKTAAKVGSEEEDDKRRKQKKKKAQKRKGDLGAPAGEGVGEHEEEAKPLTKKKKKVLTDQGQGQGDAPVVGGETDGEASATQEVVAPEDKDPLPPAKPKKKKNKKRVKKEKKESAETRPPQPTARAETRPPQPTARAEPAAKASSVPKKKAKNWTGAAISDCVGKEADVSAWKDLFVPEPVLKALSCLGFSSPTPIQALALPPAIRDRMDILGAAETGSGKTLSFGIPMIHSILEWRKTQEGKSEGISPSQADGEVQVESLYLPMVGQPAQDKDDDEEESEKDDESDVDNEEGSLGCVKVIEDVEFDFDTTSEIGQKKTQAYQNQPLLGLVLTPTRELAVQVKHHIDAVAQFTGIKTAILVGGMALQKQNRMLKRRPEMVIATPGRLWELIKEGHPHLQNLRQLRCLVIDEADRMVEKGHFAELENLLEMLNNAQFSPERQTFVFSATLTMVHQTPTRVLQKKKGRKVDQDGKLKLLMEKVGIKAKPKVIDLTRKEATVETLTETRIHCIKDDKDFYLYYFLLQYPGRSMVFANSIDCVKRLNSLLTILERSPLPLHANMHQKQRLKNLERFAEKDSCVLLTTDVAARGLDIPDVQHVIHYQVPRTSETYVHRSGRTARATKQGLSLLLIGPDDVINFRRIYRTLGKDEELPTFPIQTKCMAAIKERVTVARKIEKIEYHNSRERQHNSWFKQAAEALEVELDDDVLLGGKKGEDEDKRQQKMVKGLKKHLKHLLSQPVFKNDMKTKYPTQMGKLALPELPLASVQTALDSVNIQAQTQKRKNRLY